MLMASIFMESVHRSMFNMDLLQPVYAWTRKLVEAWKVFVDYLSVKTGKLLLEDKDPKWQDCQAALRMLSKDLNARPTKRVTKMKAVRGAQKYQLDYEDIKDFPKVQVIQQGVKEAMQSLHGTCLIQHALPQQLNNVSQVRMAMAIGNGCDKCGKRNLAVLVDAY